MKAFNSVDDHVWYEAKFCTGGKEREGHLYPRVVDFNAIFFYPNFLSQRRQTCNRSHPDRAPEDQKKPGQQHSGPQGEEGV